MVRHLKHLAGWLAGTSLGGLTFKGIALRLASSRNRQCRDYNARPNCSDFPGNVEMWSSIWVYGSHSAAERWDGCSASTWMRSSCHLNKSMRWRVETSGRRTAGRSPYPLGCKLGRAGAAPSLAGSGLPLGQIMAPPHLPAANSGGAGWTVCLIKSLRAVPFIPSAPQLLGVPSSCAAGPRRIICSPLPLLVAKVQLVLVSIYGCDILRGGLQGDMAMLEEYNVITAARRWRRRASRTGMLRSCTRRAARAQRTRTDRCGA